MAMFGASLSAAGGVLVDRPICLLSDSRRQAILGPDPFAPHRFAIGPRKIVGAKMFFVKNTFACLDVIAA